MHPCIPRLRAGQPFCLQLTVEETRLHSCDRLSAGSARVREAEGGQRRVFSWRCRKRAVRAQAPSLAACFCRKWFQLAARVCAPFYCCCFLFLFLNFRCPGAGTLAQRSSPRGGGLPIECLCSAHSTGFGAELEWSLVGAALPRLMQPQVAPRAPRPAPRRWSRSGCPGPGSSPAPPGVEPWHGN